jgi:hypothetical protein
VGLCDQAASSFRGVSSASPLVAPVMAMRLIFGAEPSCDSEFSPLGGSQINLNLKTQSILASRMLAIAYSSRILK